MGGAVIRFRSHVSETEFQTDTFALSVIDVRISILIKETII